MTVRMPLAPAHRRTGFNRCNPDQPLGPEDPRNYDIDSVVGAPRGRTWVDELASSIELSDAPLLVLYTGLPGSGKSTELRRLTERLADPNGANLLPVLVDAEQLLDLNAPIDVPDVLLAALYATDAAILLEGLQELLGPDFLDRRDDLIRWSGGYPREIVRLVQNLFTRPAWTREEFAAFLERQSEPYRRVVPDTAYDWLADVARTKQVVINDQNRSIADQMLSENVVLRYCNATEWFDLHPAVLQIDGLNAAIARKVAGT